MIKANELRIGNWVEIEYHDGKRYEQITWIDSDYSEDFNPIPLTPEILEKAGFVHEVKKYSDHYILNKEKPTGKIDCLIKVCFNESNVAYVHITGIFGTRIPITKHIHQLQNLYFALTGTELEINL